MSDSNLLPASLTKALASNDLGKVQQAWTALNEQQRPDGHLLGSWLATVPGGKVTPELADWFVNQSADLTLVTEIPRVGYIDWMSMAVGNENQALLAWMAKHPEFNFDRNLPGGGPTALYEAVDLQKWATAQTLLELGADVNGRFGERQTALHRAAKNYKVEAMAWLVTHGADPALEDMYGHQPCEMIPQDPGKEWRPDDIAQWLADAVEMTPEERAVLPTPVQDEVFVEKYGLEFLVKPKEEWSPEETRTAEVLVEREIISPMEEEPSVRPSRPRPR